MRLSDLIDIEARLQSDNALDDSVVRARDEEIAARIDTDSPTRSERFASWIRELRADAPDSLPGTSVVGALSIFRVILITAGAAIGWGAAEGVLTPDTERLINLQWWLLVFVVLQVVALVFAALGGLLLLRRPATERVPAAVRLVSGLFRPLFRKAWRSWASERADDELDTWRRVGNQVRTRRSLYAPAERWLLLGDAQLFGIAFNIAAICALLGHAAFDDLAFVWKTTFESEPSEFVTFVRGVAAPFGWAIPGSVPDLSLVEATQYARGQAAVGNAHGRWWKFLLAATAVWGLLPRTLVFAWSRFRLRGYLDSLTFRGPLYSKLDRRLTRRAVRFESQQPNAGDDSPLPTAQEATTIAEASLKLAAIRWRDAVIADNVLRDGVRQQFGYELTTPVDAGGADLSHDTRLYELLAQAPPDGVLNVAEAWESPDRGTLRHIESLRRSIGDETPIVFVLTGGSPDDHTLWRDYLGTLRDPMLHVASLDPPKPPASPDSEQRS